MHIWPTRTRSLGTGRLWRAEGWTEMSSSVAVRNAWRLPSCAATVELANGRAIGIRTLNALWGPPVEAHLQRLHPLRWSRRRWRATFSMCRCATWPTSRMLLWRPSARGASRKCWRLLTPLAPRRWQVMHGLGHTTRWPMSWASRWKFKKKLITSNLGPLGSISRRSQCGLFLEFRRSWSRSRWRLWIARCCCCWAAMSWASWAWFMRSTPRWLTWRLWSFLVCLLRCPTLGTRHW